VSFVASILDGLARRPESICLREARAGGFRDATCAGLLRDARRVRAFARAAGLRRGDRCALLAPNSIAWAAADLGLLAEGIVVVPLYARQRPEELARILADSSPALLLAEGAEIVDALRRTGANLPRVATLADVFATDTEVDEPIGATTSDPVKIFYTSGTSGEPKGVVLDASNVEPVLAAAMRRLDRVAIGLGTGERVYHYLPFCFAGAWIALLVCLRRGATLTLNTDLTRVVEDLATVQPHWFQNVPIVLDRIRIGVEQALGRRSGLVRGLFAGAWRAVRARHRGDRLSRRDALALRAARVILFPAVRQRIGGDLRALVCGSAPLPLDTQLFFEMLGIPVLQVYGLTETCAICTMDTPRDVVAGRVGRALDGVEMRVSPEGEVLVRGANVFRGYWRNETATDAAFVDGWFRTGDRGEVDADGRWRILGRVKDLLVPTSGHKVAPEPIEERLAALLPRARHVVLLGDERPHLAAIVAGDVDPNDVEAAVEELNRGLPHYAKVQASLLSKDAFTVESGLLTPNGKLRRGAIQARFAKEIDALYAREVARA
jgi:long-chain acyl-CoA synthetase